jgi:hypothetical protein
MTRLFAIAVVVVSLAPWLAQAAPRRRRLEYCSVSMSIWAQ